MSIQCIFFSFFVKLLQINRIFLLLHYLSQSSSFPTSRWTGILSSPRTRWSTKKSITKTIRQRAATAMIWTKYFRTPTSACPTCSTNSRHRPSHCTAQAITRTPRTRPRWVAQITIRRRITRLRFTLSWMAPRLRPITPTCFRHIRNRRLRRLLCRHLGSNYCCKQLVKRRTI